MAAFEENEVHGLAGEIRRATESEQYDLGGYTEIRARDLILTAFRTPLPLPNKMVKCQFVVGGGKLVRSRYDEDLTKWLIAALREIGFTEDRSAAETFDSQGTYKQQHDTGQNLKYLIVYPHVAAASANGAPVAPTCSVIDESSPEYIVVTSDKSTFQDIVSSKCYSYAQKKKLAKLLQEKNEEFKAIEAKLVSGSLLTEPEQRWYETNSGSDDEKMTWLHNEIKLMIDQGQLTAAEKADLAKQIEANVATTQAELDEARAQNKPKKVEKLEAKLNQLAQRKSAVERVAPITPSLPNSAEIQKVYIKLFPLYALEEKGRGMALTLSDLKLLEPKPDLEAEINRLESEGRGWFMEDDDFQTRCRAVETAAKAAYKRALESKKGTSKGTSGPKANPVRSTGTAGWSTVGVKKSTGSSGGVSYASAAKKTSAFSGLGGDSDDD